MEGLEKILAKLPVIPLVVLACGYLGYLYYDWLSSVSSELGSRKAALSQTKEQLKTAKTNLETAENFFKGLDTQKIRIRQLTQQLENTKGTISADVDISNFIKMITLEAKKLRLVIKSIQPQSHQPRQYFTEVPFALEVKGAYAQLMLFFDRISKLQQIIQVGDFSMKPTGSIFTKYVELDSSVQLLTFKYLGTGEDEIARKLDTGASQ